MAIHQDAGLSWLLLVSVPVLAIGNYLIVSRMLPVFRSMQHRIDGINRVLREGTVRNPGGAPSPGNPSNNSGSPRPIMRSPMPR